MTAKNKTSTGGADDGRDTKSRIIAVAERMIAGRGVQQISIRELTREAKVNLAAINYHFGSKERLIAEVIARRITVINEARMAQLDKLEAGAAGGPVGVEAIIGVIVDTMLRTDEKERTHFAHTAKMLSRIFLDPDEEIMRMLQPHFVPFKDRVVKMLARALPLMKREDIEWRTHSVFGLVGHHMLFAEHHSKELGKALNVKKEQRRLVAFCSAGMRGLPDAATH